jgi:cell division protein FtsZ
VASPLLETTINGASHVIINISGDISLMDANDAASYVQDLAGEDANIIFGAMYDDTAVDTARITVIATGLDDATAKMASVKEGMAKKKAEEKATVERKTTTQSTPTFNMPSFSMPASTPVTSNVPKKDIQIPDFLKNKR